jgi:hypothetical protein
VLDLLLFGAKKRFLDGRTDVAAAYSMRRVNSLYRGPVVRVRRSSDSVETDFGAGPSGADWGTIAAFVGAGSPFVSKWYDQSGLGRDIAQSAAAAQPAIGLLANGLPGMTFDGVNDLLVTGHIGSIPQPITQHIVYSRLTAAASGHGVVTDLLSAQLGMALFMRTGAPLAENVMFAGSNLIGDVATSQPVGTRGVVGCLWNGASSRLEVNAATVASFAGNAGTGSPTAPTIDGFSVGGSGNNSFWDNSEVQELIYFNTAHSQAQMQADNAAMRAAWRF